MEIWLIRTKEAFDERIKYLKQEYGDPKLGGGPLTFPCILVWEFQEGDCSPSYFFAAIIEKGHFDYPDKCDAFDEVY